MNSQEAFSRLGDLQLLGDLGDFLALSQQPVSLPQLRITCSEVCRRRFIRVLECPVQGLSLGQQLALYKQTRR
jgi:hypothetical protein